MMDCLIPQKLQFTTIEKFFKHCFSRCTHVSVGLEREGGTVRLVGVEIPWEGGNAPDWLQEKYPCLSA